MDTALDQHKQEIIRLRITTRPVSGALRDRKQTEGSKANGTLPVDSILSHRCRTDYETAGEITTAQKVYKEQQLGKIHQGLNVIRT